MPITLVILLVVVVMLGILMIGYALNREQELTGKSGKDAGPLHREQTGNL
jgi:hypothetical protein